MLLFLIPLSGHLSERILQQLQLRHRTRLDNFVHDGQVHVKKNVKHLLCDDHENKLQSYVLMDHKKQFFQGDFQHFVYS